MQEVLFSNDVGTVLRHTIDAGGYAGVAVLTDEITCRVALPLVHDALGDADIITVPHGEANKTLESAALVWRALQHAGATRQWVLVNLGGGMVTDLGGFAAATYMRGMKHINVPTTLLAAVDAAIGGKTGVNLDGLKNQVGTYADSVAVVVSTAFFGTLPREELLSGFAEVIKHALLSGHEATARVLHIPVEAMCGDDALDLLRESVAVKQSIVAADAREAGPRKALNLGHTVGHALETRAMSRGEMVPHGVAVAWGLVTELVLSHMALGFPSATLHQVADVVRDNYPAPAITCDDYDNLLNIMKHDKKSRAGELNCTLLRREGVPVTDVTITTADMKTALDLFRDLLGI